MAPTVLWCIPESYIQCNLQCMDRFFGIENSESRENLQKSLLAVFAG